MTIRFSVVTVVLNDPTGLSTTMASLQAQKFTDYEWIVKDGQSKVPVGQILSSFQGNIRLDVGKDTGIYDAMNRAARLCTGEYVVFMNAGDTFSDNDVLMIIDSALNDQKSCSADVIFGGAFLSFRSSLQMYRGPRRVERYLWHGLPAIHQATYYRRLVLRKYPYELRYRLCGDYYLAALLRDACHMYIDRPLATFQVGGSSYSRRRALFVEPFLVQRDVLKLGLSRRVASLVRRALSTAVHIALMNFSRLRGAGK